MSRCRPPDAAGAEGEQEVDAEGADDEPQYRPLDEVRDEIRAELARPKAQEQAIELARAVRDDLSALSGNFANEAMPLARIARRHGMDYSVLSLEGGREFLARADVALALPQGGKVAEFAFAERDRMAS